MLTYIESLKDLRYSDQLVGYEAIVKFWGADHPRNETPPPPQRWQTKIKMEIILYESLLFDIQHNDLVHGYSDKLTENAKRIPCYSIEEVLSEKMRSLVQRSYTAPRDLYDLWYLSRHYKKDVDLKNLKEAFLKKMEFKGHTFSGIDQLLNPENDRPLKTAWNNSLGHQISGELPEYEFIKQVLKDWISKIRRIVRFSVSLTVILISSIYFGFSQPKFHSGLYFSSAEVVQDERTSLNLTLEGPIKLDGDLKLDFDLKLRKDDGYFGYIFRIIANAKDNFDLIANFASSKDNFTLVFKDKYLCSFEWSELLDLNYEEWTNVSFYLNLKQLIIHMSY